MFVVTTILGYLLSVLLLMLGALLIFVQSVLGNQKLFDSAIKFLCRAIPAVFGIRITTRGLENFDPQKTYLFMANHVNLFDPCILYGHIPNFIRSVELDKHFSLPLWGFIIKRMGNIPISHGNVSEALESLNQAKAALSKGISIGILPEGHRTRDGRMSRFMRGAFRLAKNADADIIPIALNGLWERKTVHSMMVRPGAAELVFGEPVRVEEIQKLSERELSDHVRLKIEELLDSP